MKKLVLLLAMLMLLPAAAFGIQYDTMNNSSMDEVTGQSGVSIAVDDIQIFMNIDKLAWLDCDGYECGTTFTNNAGAIGIGNFQLDVLKINAVDTAVSSSNVNGKVVWDLTNATACSEIPLQYNYGDTTTGSGCSLVVGSDLATQTLGLNNYTSAGDPLGSDRFIPQALTIDATSQLPVLTTQSRSINDDESNIGGVLIGLPTVEIDIPTLSMTPAFYNIDGAEQAVNDVDGTSNDMEVTADNADYGTIVLEGVTMTVLSGWIEIAPH